MMKKLVQQIGVLLVMLALVGCAEIGPELEAPQVSLDVRAEETYTVGQDIIRIHVTASDPQGQRLTFEVIDPPGRASFQTFSNSAVFTWDPITSDVTTDGPRRLVFAVTNEGGVTTERVVMVNIQPGNTLPRFLNSASELYNPASGQPMTIHVRVRDDDSPQVILDMPPERAPEGASFEQTDDFEGYFQWMPSPVQLQQRMHTVVFVADDDDNPPVEHKVTIVIQSQDTSGPSGPVPVASCDEDEGIEHQPLGAQRTTQPYAISGRITDTSQNWEEVAVFWTTDDPLVGSPDYKAELLALEGQSFSGAIPNPLLSAGTSTVITYTICAFSNASGSDGVLCTPREFLYRFVAYSPDDDKCRDDGISMGSAQAAGEISLRDWEDYRVCNGQAKYHKLEVQSGESALVALAFSPGQEPDIEATMGGQSLEVEFFSCLGFAMFDVEGPGTVQVRVEGEDLAYHITGFGAAPECAGQQYEPNNTPGQATLVASDFVVFEAAICTEDDVDIYAMELVRGDEFTAYLSFAHAQGDLDMTLFAPSQVSEVSGGGFGVAQGWSTSDDELISYVAAESGFHYLKVVTSSTPNTYELGVERTCAVDDNFAGNHTQNTAAFLNFTSYSQLKLCENQPAWFALEHEGSSLGHWLGEVRPRYGSVGALEVTIYDAWGTVIGSGEVSGSTVDFEVVPFAGEVIYIEVKANRAMVFDITVLDFS